MLKVILRKVIHCRVRCINCNVVVTESARLLPELFLVRILVHGRLPLPHPTPITLRRETGGSHNMRKARKTLALQQKDRKCRKVPDGHAHYPVAAGRSLTSLYVVNGLERPHVNSYAFGGLYWTKYTIRTRSDVYPWLVMGFCQALAPEPLHLRASRSPFSCGYGFPLTRCGPARMACWWPLRQQQLMGVFCSPHFCITACACSRIVNWVKSRGTARLPYTAQKSDFGLWIRKSWTSRALACIILPCRA